MFRKGKTDIDNWWLNNCRTRKNSEFMEFFSWVSDEIHNRYKMTIEMTIITTEPLQKHCNIKWFFHQTLMTIKNFQTNWNRNDCSYARHAVLYQMIQMMIVWIFRLLFFLFFFEIRNSDTIESRKGMQKLNLNEWKFSLWKIHARMSRNETTFVIITIIAL